jgi:hypothetical protein
MLAVVIIWVVANLLLGIAQIFCIYYRINLQKQRARWDTVTCCSVGQIFCCSVGCAHHHHFRSMAEGTERLEISFPGFAGYLLAQQP